MQLINSAAPRAWVVKIALPSPSSKEGNGSTDPPSHQHGLPTLLAPLPGGRLHLMGPLRGGGAAAAEVDWPVPSCSGGWCGAGLPNVGCLTEGVVRWEQKRVFTSERRTKVARSGRASLASSRDVVGPSCFSPRQHGLSQLPKTGGSALTGMCQGPVG